MKRRNLVLTTESARHPFRASLPPHVFIVPKEEPEVLQSRSQVMTDIKSVFMISCFGVLMSFLSAIQP